MKMILSLGWLLIAIVHKAEPLISDNFTECRRFFYNEQVPQGFDQNRGPNSPAYICQLYRNKFHFASLYDRGRRIPLYSAYILDRRSRCVVRKERFDVEPQLVNMALNKSMLSISATERQIRKYYAKKKVNAKTLLRKSQAVHADYINSSYDRGHLNPVCHQETEEEQDATFTYTNVVPQNPTLNRIRWKNYERRILNISKTCSKMYVVTGIVPSVGDWLYKHNARRVNIPSYIWNAYCCVRNNATQSEGTVVKNVDNVNVTHMGINDLQIKLASLMGGHIFSIFQNNCQ